MNQISGLLLGTVLLANALHAQDYESYRKLTDTTLVSTHLGFEKHITITVPLEWQKDLDREFPLIVVFDRQNERSHGYIINTIDYLTSNEQMPPAIIIGVESTEEHRAQETFHRVSRETGLLAENEKFLFEELIPLAEQQYKASPFRLFIGHSRYGYFTTSLLTSRINELNGVISISPFFAQQNVDLVDSIATLQDVELGARKYYRYGIGNDFPEDHRRMDPVLRQLGNPLLDAKGLLFEQAYHNVTPGLTIATALYEIFEEWSAVQAKYFSNEQKEVDILPELENEIADHYGTRLEFALGILNGKGWFFYSNNEYEKAIAAWRVMLRVYPNYSEGFLFIADAEKQLGKDITESIVGFNSSLQRSRFYTEEEKEELLAELRSLQE